MPIKSVKMKILKNKKMYIENKMLLYNMLYATLLALLSIMSSFFGFIVIHFYKCVLNYLKTTILYSYFFFQSQVMSQV